jgi:hypothetical protein
VSLVIALIAGIFILVSVSRVSHTFTNNVFGGTCVGTPLGRNTGIDMGSGKIRIPCSGGGSMIINVPGGINQPSARPTPHHHHHNNGG